MDRYSIRSSTPLDDDHPARQATLLQAVRDAACNRLTAEEIKDALRQSLCDRQQFELLVADERQRLNHHSQN